MASLSSSPSRHSNLSFCHVTRGSCKTPTLAFGQRIHGSTEEEEDLHTMPGASSAGTSRQVSPWASNSTTPLSTPATSVSDPGCDCACCNRPNEKKRLSWFNSTPVSPFTMIRAPSRSEESSSHSSHAFYSKRRLSRANSCSSSSSTSEQHTSISKEKSTHSAICIKQATQPKTTSLVPNVQFLGLMLLIILLISSPLIKVLSVLLFIAVVFLDDV